MNMKQFEYQIFIGWHNDSIYKLAKRVQEGLVPVYFVEVEEVYHLSSAKRPIEYHVYFVNKRSGSKLCRAVINVKGDKKRLPKKVENVVKAYCNESDLGFAKSSSIDSAINRLNNDGYKATEEQKKVLMIKFEIEKIKKQIAELNETLARLDKFI